MLVLARDAWESCGSGPGNPVYMSYWRLTTTDGPAPAPAPPAPTPAGRLLGNLHELQQRSKQLMQPESAELPDMHWAMECFGSLRAVSLASFTACGRWEFNVGASCVCARSRMGPSWRYTVSCLSACK